MTHGFGMEPLESSHRILSLLPAATELACALGAASRLVGRSHACDHPESIRGLPAVTASAVTVGASGPAIHQAVLGARERPRTLFRLDAGRVRSLKPDLILTQTQCAVCAVDLAEVEAMVAAWDGPAPRIVALCPGRLPDLWDDLHRVALALGLPDEGREVIQGLKTRLVNVLQQVALVEHRPRVACLEWLDPLMGTGHWIPELVELAGGLPVCGRAGEPSRRLDWTALADAEPEVIVAMPCGFDLERTCAELERLWSRIEWTLLPAVRAGRVAATDGNAYFTRPGPRLVDSIEVLAELLHPDLFPRPRHRDTGWRAVAR